MIFPTSVKIRPLSRDIVRTESPSTSCSMKRTPLDNIIVLVSFFKTECSRRNQIRQTKITKYFLISKYIKYTSSGLDGGGSAEAEPRPWGLLGIERVDGSGYCESLVELE